MKNTLFNRIFKSGHILTVKKDSRGNELETMEWHECYLRPIYNLISMSVFLIIRLFPIWSCEMLIRKHNKEIYYCENHVVLLGSYQFKTDLLINYNNIPKWLIKKYIKESLYFK
jgi:hypothetical protein